MRLGDDDASITIQSSNSRGYEGMGSSLRVGISSKDKSRPTRRYDSHTFSAEIWTPAPFRRPAEQRRARLTAETSLARHRGRYATTVRAKRAPSLNGIRSGCPALPPQ